MHTIDECVRTTLGLQNTYRSIVVLLLPLPLHPEQEKHVISQATTSCYKRAILCLSVSQAPPPTVACSTICRWRWQRIKGKSACIHSFLHHNPSVCYTLYAYSSLGPLCLLYTACSLPHQDLYVYYTLHIPHKDLCVYSLTLKRPGPHVCQHDECHPPPHFPSGKRTVKLWSCI